MSRLLPILATPYFVVNDVNGGQPRWLALQGLFEDPVERSMGGVAVMINNDGWELKVVDVRFMK